LKVCKCHNALPIYVWPKCHVLHHSRYMSSTKFLLHNYSPI
jgi:hypothetical protein